MKAEKACGNGKCHTILSGHSILILILIQTIILEKGTVRREREERLVGTVRHHGQEIKEEKTQTEQNGVAV